MSQNSIEQIGDAQRAAMLETERVLKEVRAARARQFAKWGWARSQNAWDGDPLGHAHDDSHVEGDWTRFIVRWLGKAEQAIEDGHAAEWRDEMLCVAALAVAAIESHDRRRRG
jgi:hypothetical protein